MKIEIWRLAIDFGLMILIWMVQMLIYPSFKYFDKEGLAKWHKIYAGNMGLIVAPMMFIQVYLAYHFWKNFPDMFATNIMYTILVVLTWIATFLFFIPMHAAIDKNPEDLVLLKKLTTYNWMRVLLWTAIVVLDVFLLY